MKHSIFSRPKIVGTGPFIMLCLGLIGMDCVIYVNNVIKGTTLQRNYRKMTSSWLFS